jgi:hypothetical protein
MPKGYGYDKPPKKVSGFKMKGFSYPGESPIKGAAKREARKSRAHQAHQAGIEQTQEFATIESSQILDDYVSYVGSPLNKTEDTTVEPVKSKKHRTFEMSKEHAGKPGFQEYMDEVFGGPTTVKDNITYTEKPLNK